MLVPGVRGDKDVQYENLIIFKPEVRWKNWLASAAPQRL